MELQQNNNRRVLIIDDQPAIHDAFRKVLVSSQDSCDLDDLESELFGHPKAPAAIDYSFDVEFAFQGREGLQQVQRAVDSGNPFGLAFVDMRMPPGWNGIETIKHLWKVDPGLQIVVCTACTDHVWQDVCRELRKVDQLLLLNKPFENEYVLSLACALTEKRCLLERLENELSSAQKSNQRLEQEVSCRKSAEENLRTLAAHDALTGLPNRAVLIERLRNCITRQRDGGHDLDAILFLDVDDFKLINDNLGHNAGDDLLRQFSERMLTLRTGTEDYGAKRSRSIHRLGGDEFVILATGIRSSDEAVKIANDIQHVLQRPFDLPGYDAKISASIGIALIDKDCSGPGQLLRNADTAMYRAKQAGKGHHAIFDEEMRRSVAGRLRMKKDLRAAIENNSFEIHYQPIIGLSDHKTVGFEALVRWRTSDGTLIPPLDFISIAEDTGMMVPLGRWILEKACHDFGKWKKQFPSTETCTLSVNVSKRQLTERAFASDVERLLNSAGLRRHDLNLEVTESTIMGSQVTTIDGLHKLHGIGAKIHMDDFGTGQSSLSCLHHFPIDVLKIDRSFVAMLQNDDDYYGTIEAIVTLARHRNIAVIAEGIETQRQLAMLTELGCEFGQGFLFAKPSPASQALSSRSVVLEKPLESIPNTIDTASAWS